MGALLGLQTHRTVLNEVDGETEKTQTAATGRRALDSSRGVVAAWENYSKGASVTALAFEFHGCIQKAAQPFDDGQPNAFAGRVVSRPVGRDGTKRLNVSRLSGWPFGYVHCLDSVGLLG
jgi:hypothetical protein